MSYLFGTEHYEMVLKAGDLQRVMPRLVWHLEDLRVGQSYPNFYAAQLASKFVKVVLSGAGGDETFGGYARYLIAYWEQCIRGALDGTMNSGNFVVTYESIIPNLVTLRSYKPLIQEFWSQGIFEERDRRYFRLINRSNNFGTIVDWDVFKGAFSFEEFRQIYWGSNVGKESYFDSMTHFDFKTLLPALLQVEDRMSMAHGIESRVPLLDHPLVELAATIPSNIKFQNGELKRLLRIAFRDKIPPSILARKDKMGFPVPLHQWIQRAGPVREFILDTFHSTKARSRFYFAKPFDVEALLEREGLFGRNLWAFLSLEIWQQRFFEQASAGLADMAAPDFNVHLRDRSN
ncbi:MAG TPA: asparagine synthase C-terminal domain-containing protein, partial [Vicinamibacterales bacterium]|nr:asparagine synthase C-terminal domain-containing protein [Vicinamibacterales bacterium]